MKKLYILTIICIIHSHLFALNYSISFTGSGASTIVDSVVVQILNRGISVKVPYGYTLQLTDVTAVKEINSDNDFIDVVPNPVSSQSTLSFYAKQLGNTQITISSIDGKILTKINQNVQQGKNSFHLELPSGMYILKVNGVGYTYSKLIISQAGKYKLPMLDYNGVESTQTSSKVMKTKTAGVISMSYTAGDQFAFRGFSGNYSTLLYDQPTSSKVIDFKFAPTVYSAIEGNEKFSLLTSAFDLFYSTTLKDELKWYNPIGTDNFTVLLLSDSLLIADGFSFISNSNGYKYFANSNSGSTLGSFDATIRLQRLIKSHIFRRIKTPAFNSAITAFSTDPSFATAYSGCSYAVNEFGDMIRYYTNLTGNQMIQMLGNADDGEWVTATPVKEYANGKVFTIDKMLQYSRRNTYPAAPEGYKTQDLLTYIINRATSNTNVSTFITYLKYCLTGDGSNEMSGILSERFYTIFMPNNAAMTKAVTDGYLPAYAILSSGDAAAKIKATKFILHHFVKGKVFVDDGLKYILPNNDTLTEEIRSTALKSDIFDNNTMDTTYLSIQKDATGKLVISTQAKSGKQFSNVIKTATVARIRSNYFGAKVAMHEINDYMVYEYPQGGTPLDNSKAEAVYWELTDQPEVKALSNYRTAGASVTFKPGDLSELSFGGKNSPTITYQVASTWDVKTQYVHSDYFYITLRPTALQWMEIKTPVLKEGVYKVWFCWRRGGDNNKFKTTFKQEGKEDQVLPFTFDLGEYFNTSATYDINLANGYKQYNAKAKNSVVCSRTAGAIRVETEGRHTLRIDALSGSTQPSWWDMIQFIPIDQNQLWPRFDAAGNAIYPGTPCEQIYPVDQPCAGDLSN